MTARLGALASAVTGEVSRRSRRAFLLALGAGLLAVFALGASVLPIELTTNLLLAYSVFLAVYAVALAALLYQQFSGPFGDALAVAGPARLEAEARWRRLGAGRIPRSQAEARQWLEDHPHPAALQTQRVTVLLLAVDLDAARATLETCPTETPYQSFDVEKATSGSWTSSRVSFLRWTRSSAWPRTSPIRMSESWPPQRSPPSAPTRRWRRAPTGSPLPPLRAAHSAMRRLASSAPVTCCRSGPGRWRSRRC